MKTFIVPTDFSEVAKNAAAFAVKIVSQIDEARIILYNVYDPVPAGSDGTPLMNDPEGRKTIRLMALANLKNEMLQIAELPITCIAEEGISLTENVERLVKNERADMIVMGTTGESHIEQILFGSNAINLANLATCPVLIIPPHAAYKYIKKVMITTDLKRVDKSTPVLPLLKILALFKPEKLYVVNVDTENVEVQKALHADRESELRSVLQDFSVELHFVQQSNFLKGINLFARNNDIGLIVTVPRKHTFLSSLFKTSHTERLAFHSDVPIVAIREHE